MSVMMDALASEVMDIVDDSNSDEQSGSEHGQGMAESYADLRKRYSCQMDASGNIGRRYRRQDEIGTPLCITVDFDSLEDGAVTVRDRDTTDQIRLAIDDVLPYVSKIVEGY